MNQLKSIISLITVMVIISCNNTSTNSEHMNAAHSNSMNMDDKSQSYNIDTIKLNKGDTFYQCEMDPEVLSDKPGNCPKCGMELLLMKKN